MAYERHMLSEFPEVAKFFKPELNEGKLPEDIPYKSNTVYTWQCEHGHIWKRAAGNMFSQSGKCPYCSDKKVWPGFNDLATRYPMFAEEWDYDKNEGRPEDYIWKSAAIVHWKCKRGHEWKSDIRTRTKSRSLCPVCRASIGTSFPEQVLYYFARQCAPDARNREKFVFDNKTVEADVYVPSLNLVIEYNGNYYHKNKHEHDDYKEKLFIANEYNFFAIDEVIGTDSECRENHIPYDVKAEKRDFRLLKQAIDECFGLIGWKPIDKNIDEVSIEVYEQYKGELANFNLATEFPHIAAQWHPTKNGELTPDMFDPHSRAEVWWQCDHGHAWLSTISNRTLHGGAKVEACPYCGNRKVLPGFNDLATVHPEIAAQWHPTKNGDTTPADIVPGCDFNAWWICEHGHEWQTRVNNRVCNNTGCPYCSNVKFLKGYNDLATCHPELAAEWDWEKNETGPDEVMNNSRFKAHWKCEHGHTWEAVIYSRTRSDQNSNCPYCGNRAVWPGFNDLASQYPKIAAEWNWEKNGEVTPDQVVASSNKLYWWKCPKDGYEWKASVSRRTGIRSQNGQPTRCPVCSNRVIISGINDLATLRPDLAAQWHPTKNGDVSAQDVGAGAARKAWWQCEHGHEWQAHVFARVNYDSPCPYCSGKKKWNSDAE